MSEEERMDIVEGVDEEGNRKAPSLWRMPPCMS